MGDARVPRQEKGYQLRRSVNGKKQADKAEGEHRYSIQFGNLIIRHRRCEERPVEILGEPNFALTRFHASARIPSP